MGLRRIPLEEMGEDLSGRLEARVRRLGYLGEFFQLGAHQPRALAHFIDFTEALKEAIDWRLVEVVALTVSNAARNPYERVQHERLALKLGMPEADVIAILAGRVAPPAFTEAESLAHEIALSFVREGGHTAGPLVERLNSVAGPEVAVGVVLTAARYLAHAGASSAFGLQPPVDSPLAAAQGIA